MSLFSHVDLITYQYVAAYFMPKVISRKIFPGVRSVSAYSQENELKGFVGG